jgi:cell division GTPase FtsZ
MKIALIGCGNGGSKVVDQCLATEQATGRQFISHAIAVNSARADFGALEEVPPDHRVLIGQSRLKGHGAGTDNREGEKAAREDIHRIQRAVGDIDVHAVDAFVVATALGGGTGSGAAPVIAEQLQESYSEPVYGLGILPAENEGGLYQLNTARSFPSFVERTDNVIVFDNEVWRSSGAPISKSYARANEEIAQRFVTLFGAGELDESTAAENVIDSSEIINTLDSNGPGVSTIGYSETESEVQDRGLLSSMTNGHAPEGAETKIHGLIRQATTGQLTLPCDISSTTKALALVSGPKQEMSRDGIEMGRNWLETQTECLEVRGGDDPRQQPVVAALVLLSGVQSAGRIDQFQEQAVDAQESMRELREQAEAATEDLITDDNNDIDPLL